MSNDIRVAHKGSIEGEVIEGAFRVLDDFAAVDASTDAMKALELKPEEEQAFATAALALRFGDRTDGQPPTPITAEQLLEAGGPRMWVAASGLPSIEFRPMPPREARPAAPPRAGVSRLAPSAASTAA